MKPSDRQKSLFTRALIVGFPGVGKSTLVSKLSERYNLIWISIDNDPDVIFKLPKEWQERVDIIDIPDSAVSPMAARTMIQLFKEKKGWICNTHGAWKCPVCKSKDPENVSPIDLTKLTQRDIVVIDTVSQLSKSFLAHGLKDQPIDYKLELDDWGELRRWTEFTQSEIQGAKFNLVCIGHLKNKSDLKKKTQNIIPDFGSADTSMTFGKAFSHVILCDIINKKFRAFSSANSRVDIILKSRTDFKIEELPEPSLLPIFDELLTLPQSTISEQPIQPKETINIPVTPPQTPSHKSLADLKAMAAALKSK